MAERFLGEMVFPGETWVVPVVRRCVAAILLGAGHRDVDNARLIVSELVSNALQHTASGRGGGLVAVDVVGFGADVARIEVTDDGARTIPCPRASDDLDSRGRGLKLVEQISTTWGMRRPGSGHLTVWAEFATVMHTAYLCEATGHALTPEIGA
ncbi:ATP-binding protein [Nonomuraea sp. NPDC050680]|uniref:ATP-binding protein n=1 Tax=Nonomuraea sp. NPDC050680 TaxID=3154630 RepID=UPI0033D26A1D